MTQILPSLNVHGQPRPDPGLEAARTVNAVSTLPASEVVKKVEDQDKWKHLVVSPYTEPDHLLDLDTLDAENKLLATALLGLKCLRADYATADYLDTFNWPEVIDLVRALAEKADHQWKETSFYIVAFRSQIPPTTKYEDLGVLDKAAHAEATASGGFLKSVSRSRKSGNRETWCRYVTNTESRYWFGEPDKDGRNLATCIWRSREDAKNGGVGPAHRRASGATRSLYSSWRIDRHRLIIRDGVESWDLVEWVD